MYFEQQGPKIVWPAQVLEPEHFPSVVALISELPEDLEEESVLVLTVICPDAGVADSTGAEPEATVTKESDPELAELTGED